MSDIDEWINDIGPGWQPLARQLDADLRVIDPDYTILQVKEKFGMLRFYFQASSSAYAAMEKLVTEAEIKSGGICESCGATPAACRSDKGGYWIKTKCASCRGEGK